MTCANAVTLYQLHWATQLSNITTNTNYLLKLLKLTIIQHSGTEYNIVFIISCYASLLGGAGGRKGNSKLIMHRFARHFAMRLSKLFI